MKMRDIHLKVGDMVMVHLMEEIIPKEKYTELHMKNIGPFQIIKQHGPNAYKILTYLLI